MWPVEHTWESEREPPARRLEIIEAVTRLFAGGNPQPTHTPAKPSSDPSRLL